MALVTFSKKVLDILMSLISFDGLVVYSIQHQIAFPGILTWQVTNEDVRCWHSAGRGKPVHARFTRMSSATETQVISFGQGDWPSRHWCAWDPLAKTCTPLACAQSSVSLDNSALDVGATHLGSNKFGWNRESSSLSLRNARAKCSVKATR